MTEIVVADIGGTHARFTLAMVGPEGAIEVGAPVTLATRAFSGLEQAWEKLREELGRPLPRAASLAMAAPMDEKVLAFANGDWRIERDGLAGRLGLDTLLVMNDFGAMGHAVARLEEGDFLHLAGPDIPLPAEGTITILGPGTGLGVAQLHRHGGSYHVVETEGSHIGFAPSDAVEDRILSRLRPRYGRVSVERILSGRGLADIFEVLTEREAPDDRRVWTAALEGTDSRAVEALDLFCAILGAAAGDFALAHGASGVAIAGGLGQRLAGRLPASAFAERFVAKGRYQSRMEKLPVKLVTHPEPGLYGAAAAFARRRS
jgi:glucokinase